MEIYLIHIQSYVVTDKNENQPLDLSVTLILTHALLIICISKLHRILLKSMGVLPFVYAVWFL